MSLISKHIAATKYFITQKKESIDLTNFYLISKKILVIGGGNPELYDHNYYEIGSHGTSDYGAGLDWAQSNFYDGLKIHLEDQNPLFQMILIDQGSASWLDNFNFEAFGKIIEPYMDTHSVLVFTENQIKWWPNEFTRKMGFKKQHIFRIDNKSLMYGTINRTSYVIYSQVKDHILSNMAQLYQTKDTWYNLNAQKYKIWDNSTSVKHITLSALIDQELISK